MNNLTAWVFRLTLTIAAVVLLPLSKVAVASDALPIRHVFLVILENESADATFDKNSPAPYLSRELVRRGAFLSQYFGIGHYSLDNYIAMISGQGPNYATQNDCQTYMDFRARSIDSDGQAIGSGCVYPDNIKTLADQLHNAGFTWKSYAEDMGNDPARESITCGHPTLNDPDITQKAEPAQKGHPADQYATRHNPFMYFHSIIDSPDCAANVVNFSPLRKDLQSTSTTPNFVFIVPNLCHDGHDGDGTGKKPCVDGEPGSLKSSDKFLRGLVPLILSSPAYKQDGLLIITFDEADIDVWYDPTSKTYREKTGDASACCGEIPGPNINSTQTVFDAPDEGPGIIGPGGGRIGAVMLSPSIKAGTKSSTPYNHFALLRTIEDIFGLSHLGYAGAKNLHSIGSDVFNAGETH